MQTRRIFGRRAVAAAEGDRDWDALQKAGLINRPIAIENSPLRQRQSA